MKMALIFAVFALAVAVSSSAEIGKRHHQCTCTHHIDWHCGTDREGDLEDYSNYCVANCSGARDITKGRCPRPAHPLPGEEDVYPVQHGSDEDVSADDDLSDEDYCICTMEYRPVCVSTAGGDIEYGNACGARCDKHTTWTVGPCKRPAQLPAHDSGLHPAQLPAGSGLHPAQLPAGSDLYPAQLPAGSDLYPAQLPAGSDLHPAQLPAGSDLYPAQLPSHVLRQAKRGDCGCARIYKPVCAYKGRMAKTYDNNCIALCVDTTYRTVEGVCPGKRDSVCPCPAIHAPVCSADDDRTWSSACQAQCDGVDEDDYFPCQGPSVRRSKAKRTHCICPAIHSPVCAYKNGVPTEYSSACNARCVDKSYEIFQGTCAEVQQVSCPCTQEYAPVCSRVGRREFANICAAKCSNVYDYAPCPRGLQAAQLPVLPIKQKRTDPCICTSEWNPVCGSDGISYDNNCIAKCGGVPKKTKPGLCEDVCSQCVRDKSFKPLCDNRRFYYKNRCFATECFPNAVGLYEPEGGTC